MFWNLNLSVPGCVCLPPFSLSNLCPVHSRISLVTGFVGPIIGCGLWVFPLWLSKNYKSLVLPRDQELVKQLFAQHVGSLGGWAPERERERDIYIYVYVQYT